MPDGTTRMVKGGTSSGVWITAVAHGKYMDVVPVGSVSGSSSTHYCDMYYISTAASRVVDRGSATRARMAVFRCRMRATIPRIRARTSVLVWPSAANSFGRKAWKRIKRFAKCCKRKAPKRGAKRLKRKNGVRMVSEHRSCYYKYRRKPVENVLRK